MSETTLWLLVVYLSNSLYFGGVFDNDQCFRVKEKLETEGYVADCRLAVVKGLPLSVPTSSDTKTEETSR